MAAPPAKTGKAPPFRRRVEDALEIARAKGVAVVTITTADGATYKFDFNAATEAPSAESDDPIGDRLRLWKAYEAGSEKSRPKKGDA